MKLLQKLKLPIVLLAALTVSGGMALAQQDAGPATIPWLAAAKKGDAESQYIMGNAYAAGMPSMGIKKDSAKAFRWYMKAAKQKHANAQYEVAASFILGDGVGKNLNAARIWLKRAADNGHPDAAEVLAGFPAAKKAPAAKAKPTKPKVAKRVVAPAPATTGGGYELAGVRVDPMAMIDAVLSVEVFGAYWPWWLGGTALGLITVAFWMAMKTTLGVSSSYDRIVSWREDRDLAKVAAVMQETPSGVLESAMMAATMEQFGDDIPDDIMLDEGGTAAATMPPASTSVRVPWPVHVTFLVATAVGGFLAAFASGSFEVQMTLGDTFERYFGNGILMWAVLLVGGFLVGFGTRMGGGCTSGHGLSGCSRLQPGSLLGTASFFGTAIAVSLAMEMFL
jgi:uncharacterized membrane protein YedE/YeeE